MVCLDKDRGNQRQLGYTPLAIVGSFQVRAPRLRRKRAQEESSVFEHPSLTQRDCSRGRGDASALTNVTMKEATVCRVSQRHAAGIIPGGQAFLARVEEKLHVSQRFRLACQPHYHCCQRRI